MKTYWRK